MFPMYMPLVQAVSKFMFNSLIIHVFWNVNKVQLFKEKGSLCKQYFLLSFHFVKLSQKREKDGEQHLKEEEMRRREKMRQQEAKVRVKVKSYNNYK